MSRKDFYHEYLRAALVAAGWAILKEPLTLSFFNSNLFVDIEAERVDENGIRTTIAVEVKNFRLRGDYINEFEKSLGQYQLYREVLSRDKRPHQLFLAIPDTAYLRFFTDPTISELVQKLNVKILTFDPDVQQLVQWKL